MSHGAIKQGFDKEQIYVVEIDVPRCGLTHGSAPCTATETGDAKCYNTRATCNDLANYDETATYTYKHCTPRSPHPQKMNNFAPCVKDVSVSPAKVDPKGGIGARTSVSITMDDFPSSDRYDIDPYLSDRTYDPLEKGLYWLKWRHRNENYENYAVRIKSGYIFNGEFIENNFEIRYYIMSGLSIGGGKATIKCKDPLHLVSNKKALAPAPSNGALTGALTNSATSFNVTAGTGADYGTAPFYVKIKDEVILVNTRSTDSFSSVTRGQFNTVAVAHDINDTVQLCLHYDATLRVDEVIDDLLTNYAQVPAAYIPSAAWQSEAETYLTSNPNRLITTPTDVRKLLKELSQEWPHRLYWNDRTNTIELYAIKIPTDGAVYNELTGDDNIMELSQRDRPDLQVCTVFVRYAQFDPTKKEDEHDNYQVSYGRVNLDSIDRYESDNSITIDALWIVSANGAQARKLAQLWGRRFGLMPREVNFLLEDKDSDVWLGDIRTITHHDIVDQNGEPVGTEFEILSAAERQGFSYNALEYNFSPFISGLDDDVSAEVVDLSVNENNINLRTKYEAVYGTPDASTDVKFVVFSGVTIGSTSTGTPAIETGSWPVGATITLEVRAGGVVAGKGGDGGEVGVSSGVGQNGGDALNLTYDLTVINNGKIGGGGGGGGSDVDSFGDAGGGGGAGFGVRGPIDTSGGGTLINNSTDGTEDQGGLGARINEFTDGRGGFVIAGDGGDLGDAGEDGAGGGTAGGTAGKACDLNGNTLTQSGNALLGTVS